MSMSPDEQRLAEYLKRAVPEPPIWLSPEEITVQQAERSRKSWAMPILAAAAVVAIGVGIGAVATHHSPARQPAASSAADQGSAGPTGSAQPTQSCQAQGASVTVPSVVGMNFTQAEQILQQAGFAVDVGAVSSTAPGGTVIRQSPAPASQLARGAVIELTVSGNRANWRPFLKQPTASPGCVASATPSVAATGSAGASVAVPNVIGMTGLQAEQVLQAAGFSVKMSHEMPAGRTAPTGTVWSETPAAGSELPRGRWISIEVALPPRNRG